MLSIKIPVILLVLLWAAVHASQVTAKDKLLNEGHENKHISSNDISTIKGGYPLQVGGVGKVLIMSVQSSESQRPDGITKPLLVNKRGLQKKIARHFKNLKKGSGKERNQGKTITELTSLSQAGDVVFCFPNGLGATICYMVSCTYDPDSAVLPCL